MKKVLLIVIDALATRVVEPAIRSGRLPTMKRLVESGAMSKKCTSIFPSITPAATCSIATGCYPFEHKISGAYWYDADSDEVAYFGDDLPAIMNRGLDSYLSDFQIKLNKDRLQVPTIFERIESHGRLRDATINFLWYRGTVSHELSIPTLLKLTPGMSFENSMKGPHLMYLGDFVSTPVLGTDRLTARGGVTRRFGFHDETSADYLLELARQGALPDFTLAYFPNNDFDSHANGPESAIATVACVDETLGQLIEILGGFDEVLRDYAILITGDHSQCDMMEDPGVDLNEVLKAYRRPKAGQTWSSDDDLMICPNLRAAQIYLREELWQRRDDVIERLLQCDAVDQVIWCGAGGGMRESSSAKFHVRTQDRGRLTFQVGSPDQAQGRDDYETPWVWEGDLSTVDGRCESKRIRFEDYPNAFERIVGCFFGETANLWVTAKPGREFRLPETSAHAGGSHGALHALDSTSPLIHAGLPEEISMPESPRIVDVVPICLKTLGIESPREPGVSHIV